MMQGGKRVGHGNIYKDEPKNKKQMKKDEDDKDDDDLDW